MFGVATSLTSLRKLLPSDALQHLQSCQFTSESPQARMNSIIEAVLAKPSSEFIVSHKVAVFLRNYFLRHDGTIASFIQALKVTHYIGFCFKVTHFISGLLFLIKALLFTWLF